MGKFLLTIGIVVSVCLFASSVLASTEEVFHQSNAVGSSGWELDYGEDEEQDETKKSADKKKNEKKSEHDKPKKKEDFFNTTIDVYDKDLGSLHGRE